MNTRKLDLPIYRYVREIYKGKGKSLGEIASEARSFESDLVCWIDRLEAKEDLGR